MQENFGKRSTMDQRDRADSDASPASRDTIATEVLQFSQMLAEKSLKLSEELNMKLYPVLTNGNPEEGGVGVRDLSDYPPLFSDLLRCLRDIDSSLEQIWNTGSRVAL